jgi:hypothetical protein
MEERWLVFISIVSQYLWIEDEEEKDWVVRG